MFLVQLLSAVGHKELLTRDPLHLRGPDGAAGYSQAGKELGGPSQWS